MKCVSPTLSINMDSSTAKKVPVCFFLILLIYLSCAAQNMEMCCKQKMCPCRLYDLLRRSGNHAAGILTLGKRKSGEQHYQSQLYQILQSSRNQAAGILTVGKRESECTLYMPSETTSSPPMHTPTTYYLLKPCSPVVAIEVETKMMNSKVCEPLVKLCLTQGVHQTT